MNHSKDYLLDYAKDKELWLRLLINKVISTNGEIDKADEIIKKCYNILTNDNSECEEVLEYSLPKIKKSKNFVIENLEHISGVNALKENQKIVFNKQVTILYGPNGSGKSSYFRVLNEICGGNEVKEIIPNIYSEEIKPIQISIKNSNNDNNEIWTGQNRGIAPYNLVSVYDSSYMKGLIETRSANETLIEPFGLNLFSSLIKCIEEIKNTFNDEINNENRKLPLIDVSLFSESTKSIFENHQIKQAKQDFLYSCFNFKEDAKIEEIQKKLTSLKSNNFQTEIKLKREKITKSDIILTNIKNNCLNLTNKINSLKTLVKDYQDTKKKVEDYQSKVEVLKQIPAINSSEWKEFITSAENYKNLLEDKSRCIYCRNPLNKESISLLNAYTEYLNNTIVQESKILESSFDKLLNSLPVDNQIKIDTIIEDDYKEIGIDKLINDINVTISNELINLKESIKGKKSIDSPEIFNYKEIEDILNAYILKNKQEVEILGSNNDKKELEIKELNQKLLELKEIKSISNQEEAIKSYIIGIEKIAKLEKIKNSINTNVISTLSKKAHKEILTEKLKSNFETELSKLGFTNLKITLVEASASKGIVSTKLVLNKVNKLNEILSEGEQKAVSLAMFLAEINIRNDNNPIILDDPVNSLHHKVMKRFVERLLELENQIIIFTHNILLLSCFQTSSNAHGCKNYENGCNKTKGKHIYLYDVKEENAFTKGLIIPKIYDNYESHMESAKQTLDERKTNYEKNASTELRYAIECLIDEKILLNIEPQKYSDKNSRINWENLEKLGENKCLLKSLKDGYERLSGGQAHRGIEQLENPLQEMEIREIIADIEIYLN